MKFTPGCSCCEAPNFTGTVKGCNGLNVGIGARMVTIKGGATVLWTGTTDADGVYTGTATLPTSVTVEVAASTRFAAFTGTRSVGGTTMKTIASVTLSPATGYHCISSCAAPLADTIHLSGVSVRSDDGSDSGTGHCSRSLPDDTLVWISSPPAPWGFAAGVSGWFGQTSFAYHNPSNTPDTNMRYHYDGGPSLRIIGSDTISYFIIASDVPPDCPPSFLFMSICNPDSFILQGDATIVE